MRIFDYQLVLVCPSRHDRVVSSSIIKKFLKESPSFAISCTRRTIRITSTITTETLNEAREQTNYVTSRIFGELQAAGLKPVSGSSMLTARSVRRTMAPISVSRT